MIYNENLQRTQMEGIVISLSSSSEEEGEEEEEEDIALITGGNEDDDEEKTEENEGDVQSEQQMCTETVIERRRSNGTPQRDADHHRRRSRTYVERGGGDNAGCGHLDEGGDNWEVLRRIGKKRRVVMEQQDDDHVSMDRLGDGHVSIDRSRDGHVSMDRSRKSDIWSTRMGTPIINKAAGRDTFRKLLSEHEVMEEEEGAEGGLVTKKRHSFMCKKDGCNRGTGSQSMVEDEGVPLRGPSAETAKQRAEIYPKTYRQCDGNVTGGRRAERDSMECSRLSNTWEEEEEEEEEEIQDTQGNGGTGMQRKMMTSSDRLRMGWAKGRAAGEQQAARGGEQRDERVVVVGTTTTTSRRGVRGEGVVASASGGSREAAGGPPSQQQNFGGRSTSMMTSSEDQVSRAPILAGNRTPTNRPPPAGADGRAWMDPNPPTVLVGQPRRPCPTLSVHDKPRRQDQEPSKKYPDKFHKKQQHQPYPASSTPYNRQSAQSSTQSAHHQSTAAAAKTDHFCREFWHAGDYEVIKRPDQDSRSQSMGIGHVRVHPKFLHSNATSHKWALGALAELLDNAVDEVVNGATFVVLDKVINPMDGSSMLLIEDDGGGMGPDKLRQCMSLGYSAKSKSSNMIGQYGNGFKTSTMRLGADVIVFSNCMNAPGGPLTQSIGLLSYTFLRREGLEDIIVPMIDFIIEPDGEKRRLIRTTEEDWENNLRTITAWSPYNSLEVLNMQVEGMGPQGTKVVIFNLWYNDEGLLELDFDADAYDIQIRGANRDEKQNQLAAKYPGSRAYLSYRYSLRCYASMLYLRKINNFRIVLRGREVLHHSVVDDLIHTQERIYRPQVSGNHSNWKSDKSDMTVVTTVGFVKDAPHVDVSGFSVYHKNRLIKPFWKVWAVANSGGRGVIGVLEANFVEPAHDKQGFERTLILQRLEAKLIEIQKQYWKQNREKVGYQPKLKNGGGGGGGGDGVIVSPTLSPSPPPPPPAAAAAAAQTGGGGEGDALGAKSKEAVWVGGMSSRTSSPTPPAVGRVGDGCIDDKSKKQRRVGIGMTSSQVSPGRSAALWVGKERRGGGVESDGHTTTPSSSPDIKPCAIGVTRKPNSPVSRSGGSWKQGVGVGGGGGGGENEGGARGVGGRRTGGGGRGGEKDREGARGKLEALADLAADQALREEKEVDIAKPRAGVRVEEREKVRTPAFQPALKDGGNGRVDGCSRGARLVADSAPYDGGGRKKGRERGLADGEDLETGPLEELGLQVTRRAIARGEKGKEEEGGRDGAVPDASERVDMEVYDRLVGENKQLTERYKRLLETRGKHIAIENRVEALESELAAAKKKLEDRIREREKEKRNLLTQTQLRQREVSILQLELKEALSRLRQLDSRRKSPSDDRLVV